MANEPVASRRRTMAVRVAVVLPFLGVLALSGYEGVESRDATGAHVGVIIVVATALLATAAAAIGRHRRATPESPGDPLAEDPAGDGPPVAARSRAMVAGSAVWVVLFAAVVAWDAFSFSQQSADTATLSHLVGDVTRYDAGRAVLFALWVAAGWLIATARPRR